VLAILGGGAIAKPTATTAIEMISNFQYAANLRCFSIN
jgi:hypothetical protein